MIKVAVKWRGRNYDFELDKDASFEQLKNVIFTTTGVEPLNQKLLYRGQILKSDHDRILEIVGDGGAILLMGTPSASIPGTESFSNTVAQTGEDASQIDSEAAGIPPVGLVNLGNTCYMNATLQMLSLIKEIPEIADQTREGDIFCKAFFELMRNLKKEQQTLMPIAFLNALHSKYPQFSERGPNGIPMQHDADECLSLMLSDLSRNNPEMARLLTGKIESELHCEESGETENVNEQFMKINCIITQEVNDIFDGLKLSLKESIVKQSPALKRDAQFTKQSFIVEFPEYLLVNFTRFFWKAKEGIKAKILRKVNFPVSLNLSPLTKDQGTKADFELLGVVTHLGRSADSGHYITWRRGAESDSWWKADDDKVYSVNEQEILKLSGGGDWHTAYFCLYKKAVSKYL